jgi:hypothetical protein
MKSNLKLFVSAGFLALTVGCTDLDVEIKSKYTEYPTSEVAKEAKRAGVYYSFRNALGNIYNRTQTLSSDEATGISFEGDYYDGGVYAHLSLHDFKPSDDGLGYWSDLSSGITKCNQVINDFVAAEADSTDIAPVRVMRAFYHFILMDSFGDVPVLDRIPDEDEAIERNARKDVAAFIEKELTECLPYLSGENNASTYGKPNRWMAEALLVKLYINWAVYTCGDVTAYTPSVTNSKLDDCVRYCDDIIQNAPFDLSDSYRRKFFPDNGVQIKDFIYAMPYDCRSAQGMVYGRFRTFRRIDDGNGGYYGGRMGNSCAGNYAMNPEFSDLFCLEGDDRNGAVLGGQVYKFDASTYEPTSEQFIYKETYPLEFTKTITLKSENEQLNTGADFEGWRQGYRSVKFYPNPTEYREYNRNQSNDVPIFRYADIILTKAEALLRGATTTGDTPLSLFNQIRASVHAPAFTGNLTLQDILDERGREFFDENWRRNDMIRFGTFENEYGFHKQGFPTARFDKACRLFPVPQSVLEENSNWKQNKGYIK